MAARKTVNDLLDEARQKLRRVSAPEALEAFKAGAVLIDTRSPADRTKHGVIEGAKHYPLSVLEWRLCPTAPRADPEVSHDDRIIVICNEGYSSSLAAARLQALGFAHATDLIDGVAGWREAGLPLLDLSTEQVRAEAAAPGCGEVQALPQADEQRSDVEGRARA